MKEYKHTAVVLLLAQLCLASASADTVDGIVMAEMKRQHSPGVAIAIVKNGRPVQVTGYGLANIEQQTKVTPNHFPSDRLGWKAIRCRAGPGLGQ